MPVFLLTGIAFRIMEWVIGQYNQRNLPIPEFTQELMVITKDWLQGKRDFIEMEGVSEKAEKHRRSIDEANDWKSQDGDPYVEILGLMCSMLYTFVRLDPAWQKIEICKEMTVFVTVRGARQYAAQGAAGFIEGHVACSLSRVVGGSYKEWQLLLLKEVIVPYLREKEIPLDAVC